MVTLAFVLKRFLAQRLLGLAIVVTLGFTIGVLVAGPIYADAAREAIASSAVNTAPVTVANIRVLAYGNPEYLVAEADAVVRDAVSVLPVGDVVTQGRGTFRLIAADAGESVQPLSLSILFRESKTQDPVDHLPYRGEPPSAADEIALPAGVAQLLALRRGDEVIVLGPTGEETTFTLVGTFDPPEALDPFWFGEGTPFPAPDSTELPPALMDREAYLALGPALGVTTEFVWDVYLDIAGIPFEQTQRLPAQIARIGHELGAGRFFENLPAATGLDTLLRLVEQRVADLRVPIFLVVFQIGAVTLAVLAGVGALVLSRQSFELAVLRSRGFSGRKLLAAQGFQAVLSALAAYPLGLLLGMALAKLASNANGPSLPGVLFPIRVSRFALVLGAAAAVVGVATLVLMSLPHIRRTILEERRLLSREERPLLARFPVELFVLPLAVFTFVQLRGSAVKSTIQRDQLDPLVLLTPTLLIFAGSFLALRLLLFTLRRLDRRVGRTRRLPVYLAARRLGRSPGTSFATSLLLVLSVGLLIVSTSYRAIVLRNHEDSAHQQVGSDWNVLVAVPDQPLVAAASVPPGMTPVVRSEPSFDREGSFSLAPLALAVDPATYREGGWWRADFSDTAEQDWLRAITAPDPATEVDGEVFSATVTAEAEAEGLELVVTYETAELEVRETAVGTLEEGTVEMDAELDGADRIMSLAVREVGLGADLPNRLEVTLRNVMAGADALNLSAWQALRWRGSDGEVEPAEAGIALRLEPGAGHVIGGIAPPAAPLPVLVSPEVSRSQGPLFEATLGGQRLSFRRVAVAQHFPSVLGEFMVMSTPALLQAAARIPEAGLALNEVWAAGTLDPLPALEAAGFVPGAVSGRRADHRGARAAAAVARGRHELRRRRRRSDARGPRSGGRPVFRPTPPRVRVRVAARDGRRAAAGVPRPAPRTGAVGRFRDLRGRRPRVRHPRARDAVRLPEPRRGVPGPDARGGLGFDGDLARGDRGRNGGRAPRGAPRAAALLGDLGAAG